MDILPDPRIRQQLSAHSGWPTIPQLFIDGELVGGCDIISELYESGELAQDGGAGCLIQQRWSGPGVIGLSAARALREDGFAVTVYERDRVGSPLGSSLGRSRIYRRSYREQDYVRLARRAIDEWQRLDAGLLRNTGLLEYGSGVELHAAAMDACGEEYRWLEPAEADERSSPRPRFPEPVLYDEMGGAVMADDALRRLAQGIDVREGHAVADPRELEADVVVACPGSWLGPMFGLPLQPRIEQVTYFAGAPDTRPSVIDHGAPDRRLHYGLISPGVGYKMGEDAARPDPLGPGPPRPPGRGDARGAAGRARAPGVPRARSAAAALGVVPVHDVARRRLHTR